MHIHTQTKTLTAFMVNCLLGFSVHDDPLLLCHVFGAFCTFATVRDRKKLRFLTPNKKNSTLQNEKQTAVCNLINM